MSNVVSIPFKRESISKEPNEISALGPAAQFQFPSNGKAYTKEAKLNTLVEDGHTFQFPSNGKAYPKANHHEELGLALSFNSLQTGKHIQRTELVGRTFVNKVSFNSLQTGKHIQRKRCIDGVGKLHQVSIPFKRESISKG